MKYGKFVPKGTGTPTGKTGKLVPRTPKLGTGLFAFKQAIKNKM